LPNYLDCYEFKVVVVQQNVYSFYFSEYSAVKESYSPNVIVAATQSEKSDDNGSDQDMFEDSQNVHIPETFQFSNIKEVLLLGICYYFSSAAGWQFVLAESYLPKIL